MRLCPRRFRWRKFRQLCADITTAEGGLDAFTSSYKRMGLNRGTNAEGKPGIWYRSVIRCRNA